MARMGRKEMCVNIRLEIFKVGDRLQDVYRDRNIILKSKFKTEVG